jgi:hypothetical protein
MIKPITLAKTNSIQTIEEKLEVIRLKINEIIELLNKMEKAW